MGDRTPRFDFELPATGNPRFQLSASKGRPVALHLHPSGNTPGRTRARRQFRALHAKFRKAGATAFGISRGSAKSQGMPEFVRSARL